MGVQSQGRLHLKFLIPHLTKLSVPRDRPTGGTRGTPRGGVGAGRGGQARNRAPAAVATDYTVADDYQSARGGHRLQP